MKRLSITQLVPGMTVAEDVYDLDRELLVHKGTVLTDKLITKLDLYGILTIFAEDIIQPVRPAEDSTGTELSYSERIKSSPEFQLFKTDFENDVELFRENMNLVIQKNTSLDVNTLLKNTMAIVANHSGSISILDMLQNMREYDDSTYTHSLNVALICNILAGWLKLSVKRRAERDDHLYQQRQALPAYRTMWRRVCEPGEPAGFRDCAPALSYSGISHTRP